MLQSCFPVIVGLTGGVASGKSSVSKVWAHAGAYVIDADAEARAILQRGSIGLWLVRRRFGNEVIARDGSLDRAALARVAFADAKSRSALNARTHPLIISRMLFHMFVAVFIRCHRVVVLDTPLLFETRSLLPFCSKTAVVYCPEHVMVTRAVTRGMAKDDANRRIAAQMKIERKRDLADVIIDNSGTRKALNLNALVVLRSLEPKSGIYIFRLGVFLVHVACISSMVKILHATTTVQY